MSDNNFRKGPHSAKNKPSIEEIEIVENVSSADERKTVILDEDLEGIELEDRAWLYWKRNKNFIILTVVLCCAIIIGVQSFKMYKQSRQNALATAFEAAATPEQLAEFASANSGTKLAGIALLENADTAFSAKKFDDAAKLYNSAAKNLGSTPFFGRALLGEAVATLRSDSNKGMTMLQALSNNQSVEESFRGQAGYLYALALQDANKSAEAIEAMKKVADNPNYGTFAQIAKGWLESK